MRLKRKIAALLAVSMVVSGQPGMFTMTSAAQEKVVQGAEVSQEFDTASPSNADVATKSDADSALDEEDQTYEVSYLVDPEDGAAVKGDKKVDTGDTLEFTVTVEKGYKLTDVFVSGDTAEPVSQDGAKYQYEVEDIRMQPEVEVLLEEISYPEFSETQGVGNNVEISLYAEEGVLPEGTTFEAVELESADEEMAESAKSQVLAQADAEETDEPAYGSYQISLIGADGELLSDEEIDGDVMVTVNGVNNLMENGEIFDVDEENPIPTDVYRVKAKTNLLDKILPSTGDLRVDKVKLEKGDEYESDDAAYEMKSAVENIVLMPSAKAAPEFANIQLLVEEFADETVKVQIDGVDGETTYDLPVGTIEDNAPEYTNYIYENATYGENGPEIVAIGVYVIDGEKYEYYSIDGKMAQLIDDGKVILHYSADELEITYQVNPNEICGTVIGPEIANAGETVAFTVEPALGYKVADVKINNQSQYVEGQSVYSFEMPGSAVTVDVTFAEADSYTVTLEPLGNSAEYNYHDYGYRCDTPTEVTVSNGGSLDANIYVNEGYLGDLPLQYLVVNGQRIEVNDDGNADATIGGMQVTVRRDSHNHVLLPRYFYNVKITNIQQDIHLGYFIKDEWGIDDRTITIDALGEGVELYVKEDSQDLKKVNENDAFELEHDGDAIYFYAKAKPGYRVYYEDIAGTGVEEVDSIYAHLEYPGAMEALAYGCQWELHFTRYWNDEANRTISIYAEPIEYTVVYDTAGGAPEIKDDGIYSVENPTLIVGAAPERQGYVFDGWKLGNQVYEPGSEITLDESLFALADSSNQIKFTAQWLDETRLASYTVEYYLETAIGQYPAAPTETIEFSEAQVGEEAIANATPEGLDIEGYVLDTEHEGFKIIGPVTDDDALVLKVFYALDTNKNGEPDNRENKVTLTFQSANGFDGTEETEVVFANQLPGTTFVAPTPKDTEDDSVVFVGWNPPLPEGNLVPVESTEYTAQYEDDRNNNGEPDDGEAKVTLTFKSANGFDGTEETEVVFANQLPGTTFVAPTPKDTEDDSVVFVGWNPPLPEGNLVPVESTEYTAQYEDDRNNDGHPDNKQYVDITFVTDPEKGYFGDEADPQSSKIVENLLPKNPLENPEDFVDISGDDWVFDGWVDADGNLITTVPDHDIQVTTKWAEDKDHDNIPDYLEDQITVTFTISEEDTSKGTIPDDLKTQTGVAGAPLTRPEVNDTVRDEWAFAGWAPQLTENKEGETVFPEAEENKVDYIALWSPDKNRNNVPDEEESVYANVTLQPYATTVYSGGSNNDTTDDANSGFPNLDIQYVEAGRQIRKKAITGIYINDVNVGADVDEVFKAVYWNEDTSAAVENDQTSDIYNVTVVLGEAALGAFAADSGVTARDGYLYDANGQRMPVRNQKVEIVANEEASTARARAVDSGLITYNVKVQDSELTVRPLTDPAHPEETYRSVFTDPSQITADSGAAAVISVGSVFHTNGEAQREVERDGIRLLVDTIQDHDMDRQAMLNERAAAVLGVDAQDYSFVTRYFDLVDVNNGNAWVSSSTGTDVYLPYPDGTDQNTEFTLLHFAGLHREEGLEGKDAADAITSCTPENMTVTNTEHGILFHTDEGGFSPFVLMYRTADETPDTPDDGDEDNDHGNDSGSSDSDHNIRTGSTRESAYVVGIDGNWVHMDPANPNIPITVEVPEWATPVTNPEYHQWKFYLNNGLILWGRWAYLKNPYAVGDQPREGRFYFDNDGIMQYGWYLDGADGKWYYLHRTSDGMLGTQIEGWHFDDQDQKWYYLQPGTGEMLTGWHLIDGKWYYFNPVAPTATWNYNEATGGWTYNGSTSRPYGSMYQNEMTPDGYWVDENGAWVQ